MDSNEYWKKRGKIFSDELESQPKHAKLYMENQETQIVNFLKKHHWKNILEIGCGTGRITRHIAGLKNWDKFMAIDLSEDLLTVAKNNTHNFPIDFQCVNIDDLISEEKFDLIFSCEVIQHIHPSDINESLKKIISLSKNKIVLIETYEAKIDASKNNYCFVHNYEEIFQRLNLKEFNIHPIKLPPSLQAYNQYIRLRRRAPFAKQAIFELIV